jgi:futalosine hydrolase
MPLSRIENANFVSMKILLVAATAAEIKPLIKEVRTSSSLPALSVMISGIGMLNTSYHLVKQIQLNRPDIIIQAGVAGTFNKAYEPGVLVAVKRDRIADLGVVEKNKWRNIYDLGLEKPSVFPFRNGWLVNPHSKLLANTNLPQVSAISISEISTDQTMINHYVKNFGAVIESMEGAALHYVSKMERIPFLQIRAISNHIGERNKKKWNLPVAIKNLNSMLEGMLSRVLAS